MRHLSYIYEFFFFYYQVCKKTHCKEPMLKIRTNIPRTGIARPQGHSCVCQRFIYFRNSICLFCCMKIYGPILGINKSHTDT
jgi:hypothetical protein